MGISQRSREFLDTVGNVREGIFRRTDPMSVPAPTHDLSTGNVRLTDAPPTKERYSSLQSADGNYNRYAGPDDPRLKMPAHMANEHRFRVEQYLNAYPDEKLINSRGLLKVPRKIIRKQMADADAHRVARLQDAGIDAVPAVPKAKVKYKSKKQADKAWLAKRKKSRESGDMVWPEKDMKRRVITIPPGG